MIPRKKLDLTLIQQDPRTGEHWVQMGMRLAIETQTPPDLAGDYRLHRIRLMDQEFGQAIQDLINGYWIPVPPIQARIRRTAESYGYGEIGTETHERRIRVVKPLIYSQGEMPVLTVNFLVDWHPQSGWDRDWETYVPEYDDGKVDAPPKGSARTTPAGEDRERPGTDAAAQLPAG